MTDRDYNSENYSVNLNLPYKVNNEDKTYNKIYDFEITVIEEDFEDWSHVYRDPVGINYMTINWNEEISNETDNKFIPLQDYIINDINNIIFNNLSSDEYNYVEDELDKILNPDVFEFIISETNAHIEFNISYKKECCIEKSYVNWTWHFWKCVDHDGIDKEIIEKIKNNKYVKIELDDDNNILLKVNINNKDIEIKIENCNSYIENWFLKEYEKIVNYLQEEFE